MRPWLQDLIKAKSVDQTVNAVMKFGYTAYKRSSKNLSESQAQVQEFNEAITEANPELNRETDIDISNLFNKLITNISLAQISITNQNEDAKFALFTVLIERLSLENAKINILKQQEEALKKSQKATLESAKQLAETTTYQLILKNLFSILSAEKERFIKKIPALESKEILRIGIINNLNTENELIEDLDNIVKDLAHNEFIFFDDNEMQEICNEIATKCDEMKEKIDNPKEYLLIHQLKEIIVNITQKHILLKKFPVNQNDCNENLVREKKSSRIDEKIISEKPNTDLLLEGIFGTIGHTHSLIDLLYQIDHLLKNPSIVTVKVMLSLQEELSNLIKLLDELILSDTEIQNKQTYWEWGARVLSDTYSYYTNKSTSPFNMMCYARDHISSGLKLFDLIPKQEASAPVNKEEISSVVNLRNSQ